MFHSRSLGDTAVALLKAGAEADRLNTDGLRALDLAPDKEVSRSNKNSTSTESSGLTSSAL